MYMKIIEKKVEDAIEKVYQYRNQYPNDKSLSVVFDIDGTLLNEDTPIRPVIQLYNICKELGYHVFIITARDSSGINETVEQLDNIKVDDYTSIYFRIPTFWNMDKFKESCRKSITDKGYNIVMSIGDMEWDIGRYGGYGVLLPQVPV